MPSSDKLFTLDPINTTVTKPTTDVKVQGPANRKTENSQLLLEEKPNQVDYLV